MATTSIWSIKNNLKQSINYIINPVKTTNEDYGKFDYDYLDCSNDKNKKVNEMLNNKEDVKIVKINDILEKIRKMNSLVD